MLSNHLAISGLGAALPQCCLSNAALIERYGLDSSDEWIQSRTGIRQRYLCGEDESLISLATQAARQALQNAQQDATAIDAILVATCTAQQHFPAIAAEVARQLDIQPLVLDVNAACSGFIYGLQVAQGLQATGAAQTILLIGAEAFSPLLDWSDRSTCVLFGDGAGAVIFQATQQENVGLLAVQTGSQPAGTEALKAAPHVTMQGQEVFRAAVKRMGQPDRAFLASAGVTLADIDWLIPHQANARILQAAAQMADIPPAKVIQTVAMHANTSAASIPLAWHHAVQTGQIKSGSLLYLQAFGAGFTWGEALIKS